jgi:hypothetical protein
MFSKTLRMSQSTKTKMRTHLRLALEECCGLPPTLSALYGLQGFRSGGSNILRRAGVPLDKREELA